MVCCTCVQHNSAAVALREKRGAITCRRAGARSELVACFSTKSLTTLQPAVRDLLGCPPDTPVHLCSGQQPRPHFIASCAKHPPAITITPQPPLFQTHSPLGSTPTTTTSTRTRKLDSCKNGSHGCHLHFDFRCHRLFEFLGLRRVTPRRACPNPPR